MSLTSSIRADRKGNQLIARALQGGTNLAKGANQGAVRWLERMLKLAGHNPGKLDNVFDSKTASVIKQFQAARGLPATGELDLKTFEHLKSVQGRVRDGQKAGRKSFGAGQKDELILDAEKRLRKLGYDTGKADGLFDEKTRKAMREFQADQGKKEFKKPGTLLGETTRKALSREVREWAHAPERRRKTKGHKEHKRLDAATAQAVARKRQEPVLNPDGTPRLDDKGNKVRRTVVGLRLGDKSRAVQNVQSHLKAAGYDVGVADGKFDARTLAALNQFQKKAGIKPTDTLGPNTWKKLNRAVMLAKDGFSPAQRMGERSSAVKRSEALLQKLGYLKKGEVDGLFDKDTQKASRRFEARYGGGKDGAIGEAQFEKMEKVLKARQNPLGKGKRVTGYRNGVPFKTTVYNVGGGEFMQKNAAINYLKMVKAAKKAGFNLTNTSGFRTYSEQAALYAKYGPGRAARPGYSNHQQGLSMDIGGSLYGYGTAAYSWMQRNAGRFGFRNDVAGEWWHWTYYGR